MPELKKIKVLKALQEAQGFVTTAARRLKVNSTVLSRYIQANPDVEEFLNDINEQYLDVAEMRIISQITSKDAAVSFKAASFYLTHKGKNRGYNNRTPFVVDVDFNNLTDEQLNRIANGEPVERVLARS